MSWMRCFYRAPEQRLEGEPRPTVRAPENDVVVLDDTMPEFKNKEAARIIARVLTESAKRMRKEANDILANISVPWPYPGKYTYYVNENEVIKYSQNERKLINLASKNLFLAKCYEGTVVSLCKKNGIALVNEAETDSPSS